MKTIEGRELSGGLDIEPFECPLCGGKHVGKIWWPDHIKRNLWQTQCAYCHHTLCFTINADVCVECKIRQVPECLQESLILVIENAKNQGRVCVGTGLD